MIVNLTQHDATPEQLEAGVVEPSAEIKALIKEHFTFDEIPSRKEIRESVVYVCNKMNYAMRDEKKAQGKRPVEVVGTKVMIGGAPFMMSELEGYLKAIGFDPVYAFSKREVQETHNEDGSVTKQMVFRHSGFVPA